MREQSAGLSVEERYRRLRRSGRLAPARRLDEEIRGNKASGAYMLISVNSPAIYSAGIALADIDRELRRTAALISRRSVDQLPRPVPLREGRLELVDAGPGSFEVVTTGVGVLSFILLSHPVQTFMTLGTLIGQVRSIQVWLRVRRDPLAKISAKDALAVLKAYRELPDAASDLGPPTQHLEARNPPTSDQTRSDDGSLIEGDVDAGPSQARLELPGGIRISGTRIVYARQGLDGTSEVVVVE
jgi:hypothetical protein